MKGLMTGTAALAVSLLLNIGNVSAADNAADNHTGQKFFKKAAQGGLAEVTFGQMAADKAASEEVKRFGQRMVTDHGQVNKELQTLAASEGVTLPTEMDSEAKAFQKKLAGLSGDEFDKTYMKEMLKDHKEDLSLFKKQAEQGKDEDVKNWAAKQVPTLQEHYELAQATQKQVQTSAGPSGTSAMTDSAAPRESRTEATHSQSK